MFSRLRFLIDLTHSHRIARRYFVTNGFDGVLAMLGLLMGFRVSDASSLPVMIGVCFSTAFALFMSGLTSAYISESAEKEQELRELESSMVTSLDESAHAEAARLMPWMIAMVNGLSPLLLASIILSPLVLAQLQIGLITSPVDTAIGIAMLMAFILGAYLGRISGRFWVWTGLRALIIAAVMSLIIFYLNNVASASL